MTTNKATAENSGCHVPIITLPLVKKQWYCAREIHHSIKSLDGVTKIEVFREME